MLYGKKSKIYKQMMYTVIISVVLCIALCGGSICFYMFSIVRNSLIENSRNMILKMSQEVANSVEGIAIYAENISFDDIVQKSLKTVSELERGSYSYYSAIQRMEKKLKEYKVLRDNLILDIFTADPSGGALEVNYRYESLIQEPFFENALEKVEGGTFLPIQNVDYYELPGGQKDTIAYINKVYDKEKIKNELGTLIILMDQRKLIAPLEFDNNDVRIELHGKDGTLIYKNIDTALEGVEQSDKYEKVNIGNNGWYICYQITARDISNTIRQISVIVIGIAGIIMIIMMVMFVSLVRKIARPLEIMFQGVQKVSDGNWNEKIFIHTGDECEMAANLFNTMIDSINDSREKLVESERKRYASQLEMLSYQLNPHFIYNTLNAVICLARRQDYAEVIHLTRIFMTILRSVLQTDLQAVVPIQEEQDFIDRYVEVLQICYQNVPNVQWDVPKELELPRMILYPLVENSVFHGIVSSDSAGLLKISIIEKEGWVRVQIEDDGIGCSEGQLEEIRDRLKRGEKDGHIGLYNINERLKLIYREYRCLEIENRDGGGTKISFGFKQNQE